ENLVQALHTLNGDTLATKLADKNGRIARLLKENKSSEDIVQELYMAALCRPPSDAELEFSVTFVKESATPQEGYEDVLWSLMNSKYFLFIH
ncbi:MAG: S-layer related protein (Precursor), partial [Planctomycetota bacterium]|nr:S-layer related protein (Precursor) [Planctomycetota bacterium]